MNIVTILFCFFLIACPVPVQSQNIDEFTQDMDPIPGFFDLYYDTETGNLYMTVDNAGDEFLYLTAMATGAGTGSPRILSSMVISGILNPERTARIVNFSARDSELPSFSEVLGRIRDELFVDSDPASNSVYIRLNQQVYIYELIRLAANPDAIPEVRNTTSWFLKEIKKSLGEASPQNLENRIHLESMIDFIDRFLNRRDIEAPYEPPPAPGTWFLGG